MLAPALLLLLSTSPSSAADTRVRALEEVLKDEKRAIRRAALQGLVRDGKGAVASLLLEAEKNDPAALGRARRDLVAMGPDALPAICVAAQELSRGSVFMYETPIWQFATKEVGPAFGPAAVPKLGEMFQSDEHYYRQCAKIALEAMPQEAVPVLIPLLKSDNEKVRGEAVYLLAGLADSRAADAFLEGLNSRDHGVRMYAAAGLGRIRDRRAIDGLLRLLDDDGPMVREFASGALGAMWERRFFVPLVKLLRTDPQLGVRDAAAEVLIRDSHDPLAIRVAKRYRPLSIDPGHQDTIHLANFIRLAVTVSLLYGFFCIAMWLFARGKLSRLPASSLVSVAALLAGFLWGFLMYGVTPAQERLLLLLFIPVTALWGSAVGPIPVSPIASERGFFRRTWALTIGSFYVGYGIGWLALWGHLGF